MPIDIAFLIVMIIAIFKGFSKGIVLGIFSLLAFIIGLAAALKPAFSGRRTARTAAATAR